MSKEPSHAAMPTRKYRPSGQSSEPVDEPTERAATIVDAVEGGVVDPVENREIEHSTTEIAAPAPSTSPENAQPKGFGPMADAPTDGRKILVTSDGISEVEASWRVTRQYVPAAKGGAWHETGVWAIWNSGGAKVPFEPVGWREAP